LLTLTGACAIHCRYCFRRHFPYSDNHPGWLPNGEVVKYLTSNPQVEEVILSGGDPLMASDQKLQALITSLNDIGHIRRLRIHSRVLTVLPQRITADLIEIFCQFNGQLIFVSHINHPNELEPINRSLFELLAQKRTTLLNQSVLLKGINDNSDTLIDLSYKLFDSHVLPYYLHRLDQVRGSAHFDIGRHRSCEIYRQMLGRLPGYLVPRLVEEVPGKASKTPVQCSDLEDIDESNCEKKSTTVF
jgi:EF-P beta-lysylation protein EpmB